MIEREGQLPLLHSVLLDKDNTTSLSFRYWDYEAWIMSKFANEKILLLGIGGATSLQILKKLNITPKKVIGVDIDANELKEKEILNYSYLTIVESDAYTYLNQTKEKFDLILVDVYNFKGYVENIYKDMELLNEKLYSNGVIAFHCLDPMIKYSSFNFRFNELRPSPSYEISSLASLYFDNVYTIPLWTSSLILAEKNELTLFKHINSKSTFELNKIYNWLDKFYKFRISKFNKLEDTFTRFKAPLDYKFIEKEDGINLKALFNALNKSYFKNRFIKVFGDIYNNKGSNDDKNIKIEYSNDTNMEIFFLMCEFMATNEEELLKGKLEWIIDQFDNLKSKESSIAQSYLLAYAKKWDEAIKVLK